MSTETFYKRSTLALVLLNVGLLTFFMFHRPPPPPNGGFTLKKTPPSLQLDETQKEVFLALAKTHHNQIVTLDAEQCKVLHPYFSSVLNTNIPVNKDSIMLDVNRIEQAKIELTLQHFKDVKAMLTAQQEPGFKIFLERALNNILSH